MDVTSPPSSICTDWKPLYHAAIQEADSGICSLRLIDAEKAILTRARELFYNGGRLEEKEALEDALCIVRALRIARAHSEAA